MSFSSKTQAVEEIEKGGGMKGYKDLDAKPERVRRRENVLRRNAEAEITG